MEQANGTRSSSGSLGETAATKFRARPSLSLLSLLVFNCPWTDDCIRSGERGGLYILKTRDYNQSLHAYIVVVWTGYFAAPQLGHSQLF
jgi:hypothetical protein